MNPKTVLLAAIAGLMSFGINCSAQEAISADRTKELNDYIETKIREQERILDLEGWQTFYLDSIYTHDYFEMEKELQSLDKAKVGNTDIYLGVQDKWEECIYQAVFKVLDEQQWKKYLKTGVSAAKKARDKRQAKRESK